MGGMEAEQFVFHIFLPSRSLTLLPRLSPLVEKGDNRNISPSLH
jgi:hypothetical protein